MASPYFASPEFSRGGQSRELFDACWVTTVAQYQLYADDDR